MALKPRQELFVNEYLKDLNATQAAKRAGYTGTRIRTTAYEMLQDDAIAAAIAAARAKQLERIQLDADWVLRKLIQLAEVDLALFYDDAGNLLPVHEIPPEARAALAGIEVEELFAGQGQQREHIGRVRKIKVWDKTKALEMLGRHLKMFTDKVEVDDKTGIAERIRIARGRSG